MSTLLPIRTPTPRDPLTAADAVAAVAAEQADVSEADHRLARPVMDAIVESHLARLIAPTAIGGDAADPVTLVRVIETVARADTSAGWCLAIGMGVNHLSGYYPYEAARALYRNLDRLGAGVFAPSGRAVPDGDGYRVTGRWSFASGCQHAAVQLGGVMVADANGTVTMPPTVKLAAMASTQVVVHETWDTAGMRGTGSHDVSALDVVVAPDQLLSFTDRPWADDPIFRVPPFTILGPCLAAVPLGVGRAALDVAASAAVHDHEHPPVGRIRGSLGDDRALQQAFGQAEVALRAARALLLETLESQQHRALEGRPLRRSEVALVGLACTETMAAAEQAIDTAARQIGSGSARHGAVLERARRDADTMRHHPVFSVAGPALARQLAGIPTEAYPYLIGLDG